MINRFALSFLCIELDRNEIYEVMLVYILLTGAPLKHIMGNEFNIIQFILTYISTLYNKLKQNSDLCNLYY